MNKERWLDFVIYKIKTRAEKQLRKGKPSEFKNGYERGVSDAMSIVEKIKKVLVDDEKDASDERPALLSRDASA